MREKRSRLFADDFAEPGNLSGEVHKRGCHDDLKGFNLRFSMLLSARSEALQETGLAGLVLELPVLAPLRSEGEGCLRQITHLKNEYAHTCNLTSAISRILPLQFRVSSSGLPLHLSHFTAFLLWRLALHIAWELG